MFPFLDIVEKQLSHLQKDLISNSHFQVCFIDNKDVTFAQVREDDDKGWYNWIKYTSISDTPLCVPPFTATW